VPHIIVEYSTNVEKAADMQTLTTRLHEALAEKLGSAERIKTRAVAADYVVIGDKPPGGGAMAHITLLLLEGRNDATKQEYGQALHKVAVDSIHPVLPDCKITLEVRDMEKASYILG
jgi:5-carboxymethyl-2-hydroxymuconate isomerase